MEYNLVQHTTRAPFNKCFFCGGFTGPFIDTFFDQHGHGAVFICAPSYEPNTGEEVNSGCLGAMARLCGWVSPHDVETMQQTILDQKLKIEELESLERQVIIPEGELKQYITSLSKPKPKVKAPDPYEVVKEKKP